MGLAQFDEFGGRCVRSQARISEDEAWPSAQAFHGHGQNRLTARPVN